MFFLHDYLVYFWDVFEGINLSLSSTREEVLILIIIIMKKIIIQKLDKIEAMLQDQNLLKKEVLNLNETCKY